MTYLWLKAAHVIAVRLFVGGTLALLLGTAALGARRSGEVDPAAALHRWDARATPPAMVAAWTRALAVGTSGRDVLVETCTTVSDDSAAATVGARRAFRSPRPSCPFASAPHAWSVPSPAMAKDVPLPSAIPVTSTSSSVSTKTASVRVSSSPRHRAPLLLKPKA